MFWKLLSIPFHMLPSALFYLFLFRNSKRSRKIIRIDTRKNGIMFWVSWQQAISHFPFSLHFLAILPVFSIFRLLLFFYYALTVCWSTSGWSGHPDVEKSPYLEQVDRKAAWKQMLKNSQLRFWRPSLPSTLRGCTSWYPGSWLQSLRPKEATRIIESYFLHVFEPTRSIN